MLETKEREREKTINTEDVRSNPLGFLMDAMTMGSSEAIYHQEAQGQRQLVNSESLPARMNGARPHSGVSGVQVLGS